MTGIVGVWNRDGCAVERSMLARRFGQRTRRNQDIENFWLDGPIAFDCLPVGITAESTAEHQPVNFGSIACVFDGRLDNRAQLFADLQDRPLSSPKCPDSNLVAAAYDRFGESFVDHLY